MSLSAEEEVPGGRRREEPPEPEANFELSGKLAAESNRVNGVVLQHQEPLEARKPTHRWRLYVFKGGGWAAQYILWCVAKMA